MAVSNAVRAELCAAGLDASRIEVVPDGVELAPPIASEERLRARERWGIPGGAPVAGYVASFTAEKGHALLLDAFAELRRSVPACRLLLAGSGPLQHSLQETARAAGLLPAVIFGGFVEDTRAVYAACDVFLFPSLREGLGSSLLDAMSCALPVVAFEGGAAGEILEDGRDGLLVAPAAAPLAAAATRLLTDNALARRLGEAARQTVSARFSAARNGGSHGANLRAPDCSGARNANAGCPSARDRRRLRLNLLLRQFFCRPLGSSCPSRLFS